MIIRQHLPCTVRTATLVAIGWFTFFPPAAGATDPSANTSQVRTYSLGIVPQHKAADLAARWVPLLEHLNTRTGLRIEFHTARDIPTFEQKLAQGEYDFAYMNPLQYVLFQHKPGYRALARQHAHWLRGIVVVHMDSPYRKLQDLEGQALAFPSAGAFAASILTRTQLLADGIRFTPNFVVSHDSVYYSVANRLFAGGGGAPETLDRLDLATRAQLRVIWTSTEYTPHPFAVQARVPADVAATLQRALIEAGVSPVGKQLLTAAGLQELVASNDEEYEPVRKLTPGIRATLCPATESTNYLGKWLCPDTFARDEMWAPIIGAGNSGL